MRKLVSMTVAASAVLLAGVPGFGQQADDKGNFPWEGEVAGMNVYVRSGAGNNWYPTTKLNVGDRVLVMGERYGWYQVAPPAGSVSYIDVSTVDRKAGSRSGTVKQDKVYVRAGSALEPQRKSSTQVVLNKGATVEITGEADGFYQIKPPQGATLYISKQYVKPVSASLRTGMVERHVGGRAEPIEQADTPIAADAPTDDRQAPPSPAPSAAVAEPERVALPPESEPAAAEKGMSDAPGASTVATEAGEQGAQMSLPSGATPSPNLGKPHSRARSDPAQDAGSATGRFKAMLTMVEGELNDMLRRPFEDQDFASLIKRYEPIARQSEESIPSQIAKIRIRQLQDRTALRLARLEIDKDGKDIEELRANMDKERAKIMNRRVDVAAERYELEGELRESFAFAPENRRYRLVDPKTQVTVAYVDIPTSVEGNPRHLVGQLVGIRTSGRKFSPSARVPIAVASEVVDLSPRRRLQPEDRTGIDLDNNQSESDNTETEARAPAPRRLPDHAEARSGTDAEP